MDDKQQPVDDAPPSTAQTSVVQQNVPDNDADRPRIWTPVFVLTIVITFFAFVSGQGLNSGMSVYVEQWGGTTTFAGVLMGVFCVSAAVSRIVVGPLIDKRGRRVIMVTGAIVLAIGILLPGLKATTVTLVIGRLLQGVGFAAATTAASTAASDTLPNEHMSEGISYYGLGQALATSVGPAFALYLIDTDPPENLFYVLTIVAVITAILAALCRYEKKPSMLQPHAVWRLEHADNAGKAAADEKADDTAVATTDDTTDVADKSDNAETESSDTATSGKTHPNTGIWAIFEPRALPGAVPMLFMSAAFGFCVSFAGLYGENLGIAGAGAFYTCSAVSMILIRLASKPLMNALAPIKTFAIAGVCGIIGFILMIAAQYVPFLFYIAGLFYGVCLGISLPLNQSVAVQNTPPERWGATNALYLLASDIGMGVASVIWGVTNNAFGFTFTLCCVIVCIVVAYILALVMYPPAAKGRA